MKQLTFKGEEKTFRLHELKTIEDVNLWIEHTGAETHKDMQQWLREVDKETLQFEPRTSVFKYIILTRRNPVYELYGEIERYRKQLYGYLNEYDSVFVNKVGGFMFTYEHFEELLISEIEVDGVRTETNFTYVPSAEYLVLENDYAPDGVTLNYFETIDKKFSSVVNLREEIQRNNISEHLRVFYQDAPKGIIFVNTTGGDGDQIQNMFKMLVEQLKVPEIHINIPNPENYTGLVAKAKELGTTIEFVNVYI